MARKIKFALEMADGAKVRGSLEELREHFDLETVVGHFLSGKLMEWLEDRYYEDELEALEKIDKDAPNFHQQLCDALGVECQEEGEMDVEALERLNEKKAILRQKTSDEEIISHAAQTALTQEDLADLLDVGESVIYLCGENFTIPSRVKNKKYVGILGMPTISIKANSQKEVDEKGIVFENVKLPWRESERKGEEAAVGGSGGVHNALKIATARHSDTEKEEAIEQGTSAPCNIPMEELREIFVSNFGDRSVFDIAVVEHAQLLHELFSNGEDEYVAPELTETKRKIVLRTICKGKYREDEIVYLRVLEDLSSGWALTKDSICIGGQIGNYCVKYNELGASEEGNGHIYSWGKWEDDVDIGEYFAWETIRLHRKDTCFAIPMKDWNRMELLFGENYGNLLPLIDRYLDTVSNLVE